MNIRTTIRIVLSTIILAAAVWFVVRDVDMALVATGMREANILLLITSVPLVLLAHVVRAMRWQVLLQPVNTAIPLSTAFNAVMIGYAANTIVPRSGEVLRPLVLARRCTIPSGTALSSVLIERVIDVVTLLAAILIVVVLAPRDIAAVVPGFTVEAVLVKLAVPIAVITMSVALVVFTERGRRLATWIGSLAGENMRDRVSSILGTVRDGMAALQRPKLYAHLVVSSAGIWMLYILPVWLVARALPYPAAQGMGLATASVLLVVIAIGVTIAPTPGALGVYQTFAQTAYVALAAGTLTDGLVFGILSWIVNYGVAFLVGAISWFIETRHGLRLSLLRSSSSPS